MILRFEIKGLRGLRRELKKAEKGTKSAMAGGIYAEAQNIMDDSVSRTPEDTGALRASAFVSPPSIGQIDLGLGYGASYAVPVHERTELRHSTGEAKFLQKAMNRARSGLAKRIGSISERLLKRGSGLRSVAKRFPQSPPPIGTDR